MSILPDQAFWRRGKVKAALALVFRSERILLHKLVYMSVEINLKTTPVRMYKKKKIN